jgi:hypothetical protein
MIMLWKGKTRKLLRLSVVQYDAGQESDIIRVAAVSSNEATNPTQIKGSQENCLANPAGKKGRTRKKHKKSRTDHPLPFSPPSPSRRELFTSL